MEYLINTSVQTHTNSKIKEFNSNSVEAKVN